MTFPRSRVLVLATLSLASSCGAPSSAPSARVTSVWTSSSSAKNHEVRIAFDSPVIGEERVGAPLERAELGVSPPFEYESTWHDRQTLVLFPREKLLPATRYKLSFQGALGERLKRPFEDFLHEPLEMLGITGTRSDLIPTSGHLTMEFNHEVAAKDVPRACNIVDLETKKTIELTAPNKKLVSQKIELQAKVPLRHAKDYELHCQGLAAAHGNEPSMSPWSAPFSTLPELSLVSHAPKGHDVYSDEVRIELSFSTEVDLDAIRKALSIQPHVADIGKGSLDYGSRIYSVELDLAPMTSYAISIAPFQDVHGQTFRGPSSLEFTTGNTRPRLRLETGIYAVESAAAGYPVWTRGLTRFDVSCSRVPKQRVIALLTSNMNYDPWYDASGEEIDWAENKLAVRQRRVQVNAPRNEWRLQNLDLPKMCGGEESKGLFLAELGSDELSLDPDMPWRYRPKQRVLANVTDLGVLLKAGSESGLVWVTRLSTGEPVAGAKVAVFSPSNQKRVALAKTDADGLARISGTASLLQDKSQGEDLEDGYGDWRSRRLVVIVEDGTDMAVVDGNWSNGIQIWNFGVTADYGAGETKLRGFILSDRGIYRPQETVHFKGLVRRVASGAPPRVPRGAEVDIEIEDPRGNTVHQEKHTLGPYGSFSLDFSLEESAAVGDYYVTARVEDQVFREQFVVDEFRKATFDVKIEGASRHTKLGVQTPLEVDARYFFGAPVADAEVSWTASWRPHVVHSERYPEFSFSDNANETDFDCCWDSTDRTFLDFLADGSGKTNDQGRSAFSLREESNDISEPRDYVVRAIVQDSTGETVTASRIITAHKSDFYLGLHTQEWVQAVGMPFAVEAIALSADGAQVSAKARLSFVEQSLRCEWSQGAQPYRTCRYENQNVWTKEVDIPSSGTLSEPILPTEPGQYLVRIDTLDSRGNAVAASRSVFVLGKGQAFWSGDESARMSIVSSKQVYEPGEIARLVPRSSIPRPTVLVTLERGGILDAFVQRDWSASQGLEVPIESGHAPNVFASVAFVKGRTGAGDQERPRFQMGVVELGVSAQAQRLEVVVETDKTTYQPKEKVRGTITVTSGGRPVRAEVCLSAADEGVLRMVQYQTPNPHAAFYQKWGLGVDASTNLNRIARIPDPFASDPDEGADAGDGSSDQVRSRFVSSAYWNPTLVTKADGKVSFEFEAPDDLTSFRLMAVAADAGARFGSSDLNIIVTKPLLARPLVPRFAMVSDSLSLGAVIHNKTDTRRDITVTVRAEGIEVIGKNSQNLSLEAGASGVVRFEGVAGDTPSARVEIHARTPGFSDAFEVSFPIERPVFRETRSFGEGRFAGKKQVAASLATNAIPAESFIEIEVDRTGLGTLSPALRYLIEYPYGCLEQTLSRLIPLTKVEDLAKSMNLEELRGPRLQTFISAGVSRVVRHQHPSGHFGLWPGDRAQPHLTAYALFGLIEAQKAGVKVDQGVVERATTAAKSWANSMATPRDPGELGTMAMTAWAAAQAQQADPGLVANLYARRANMPVYGKAFLLLAMSQTGADLSWRRELTAELLSRVEKTKDGALIKEIQGISHWYMSSDTRSTAVALSALLAQAPDDPNVHLLAAGLRASQLPHGGWRNTQENAYALVALADYARNMREGTSQLIVHCDGKLRSETALRGMERLALRLSAQECPGGNVSLEASSEVFFTVRAASLQPIDFSVDADHGFAVSRRYLNPHTHEPLSQVRVGDLVKVVLSVKSRENRHYVALVDRLPAGFEPVNTTLAHSQIEEPTWGSPQDRDDEWNAPASSWTYIEHRDDRVQAFANFLGAGELELDYLVRALTPGRFLAPPVTVEQMYSPQVHGRGRALAIEVKP